MLNKVNYVDDTTVIHAKNLNDIQDAIIKLESSPAGGGVLSVNSKTPDDAGDVTLTAADVGAIPNKSNAVTPSLLDRTYAELGADGKVKPELISSAVLPYDGNHTLQNDDAGRLLLMVGSAAQTITIPAHASVPLPIGTEIEVAQWGAGSVTFAPAAGVSIGSMENKYTIAGTYGFAAIKKLAEDVWALSGALT